MLHWNEPAAVTFVVNLAVKSTLLMILAWLLAKTLRGRSAAVRHLVWMAAFVALLALPVFSLAVPALELPAAWLAQAPALVFGVTAAGTAASSTSAAASAASAAAHAGRIASTVHWPVILILVWGAGCLLLLMQTFVAYARMSRRRRVAPPFDAACDLPHGIRVLEAEEGSMPMAFGVLHPVVFLPADACDWTGERRALVLRHELAHIERGDAAMHLAARAAVSTLWWNPLAWIGWREFLKEREKAADDLVLSAGARASDYAGHLLEIARSMQSESATAWAAVAMARRSQLEGRLLSILDERVSRKSARRGTAIAAATAALALCAPFAAVRAQDSQALPPDVQATIRAATSQKNHDIVDTAAAAFEKIGNYDTARKLLDAGLDIRASEAGEQSALYAAGLVNIGELESKRANQSEAVRFDQKAVSLGDSAQTAAALLYLAGNALGGKDLAGAMDYLQRTLAVSDSPQTTGQAYMWMALIESKTRNHAPQAEEDFRKSIASLNPNSSEMATSLSMFAFFLEKQDRAAEAEPLKTQSAQIIHSLESANRTAAPSSKFAVHVGNGVTPPKLLHKVEPEYSEEARAAAFQGVVVLSVVIEPDGIADNMQVLKSLGLGLDQKAIQAVQQWQFQPGMMNGAPVPVAATIEVNFRLL